MDKTEFLKRWHESGKQELAAQIAPETVNDDQRTVDVIFYTGADIDRYSWIEGSHVLRFDPKGADLSLLNNGAPVCDNHWMITTDDQKGRVDKAWVDGSDYKATLRFKRSTELTGPRPDIDGLWQDIKDKIVSKFSMGVEILESVDQRNKDGQLEIRTATKWRPFELSLAPIPADFGTTTLSKDAPAKEVPPPASEAQRATAQLNKEVPTMDPKETTGGDARLTEEQLAAAREEGARLEREKQAKEQARKDGIDQACAVFLRRKDIDEAFVARMKSEGKTVEQTKTEIVEVFARKTDETPVSGSHASVKSDAGDKVRETMAATLLYRYEPLRYKDLQEKAREFMGYSLMEMARECLRNKGVSLSGRGPSEIAQLALTTSDFANILADVANKSLRAGYETYPNTFAPFCRRATVRDFKAVNRTQLSGAPSLLKVNEHGEIEHGYLTDGKESYSIASYGRIVAITRKTIINDDLGALTRVPALMGMKAAMLEGDIVWGKITANGAMADGQAVFSAAHSNIQTAGGAPSATTVGAAAAAMTLQKGLEGDVLNLTPSFLAAPINLRLTVETLLLPKSLAITVTNGTAPSAVSAQPGWIGALTPIFEPRLDTADNTGWYLFANPAQVDTVEYAYLEGNEGVRLEQEQTFDIDGVRFRALHDFGAGVIDYRGMYFNDGE